MDFLLTQLATTTGGGAPPVGIESLPLTSHAGAAMALLGGLMLWIWGHKLLKVCFLLGGAAFGATAGAMVPPALGADLPLIWTVGVGAFVGLIGAFIAFRFAIALSLGLTLAAVAPLAAATFLTFQPAPEATPEASAPAESATSRVEEALERWERLEEGVDAAREGSRLLNGGAEPDSLTGDEVLDQAAEFIEEGAARVRAFLKRTWTEFEPRWERMSIRERFTMLASIVGGGLAGFALGMALPKKAAGLVTAFVGAAVWIPAGVWLVSASPIPAQEALPTAPAVWLAVWVTLSIIGTWIQWTLSRRRADKE